MIRFEAWQDENGTTLSDVAGINQLKEKGLIESDAVLLHVIMADTSEEASAVHHIKMGWEPYKPEGEPELCPNRCGSYFYPKGSGECPKCGQVK